MARNYDEKSLIGHINSILETANRDTIEKQWALNIAFYLGKQWVTWNSSTKRLEEPPAPSWRVRITENNIAPIVDLLQARMTKNKPRAFCKRASDDEEDKAAAEIGEMLLEYQWEVQNMRQKLADLVHWVLVCGTGFLHPRWDDEAGDHIVEYQKQVDEFGNVILDAEGNPIPVVDEKGAYVEAANFHLGEAATDVVSPMEMYVDPLSRDIDQMRWIMRVVARDVDWVYDKYGVKVSPEDPKSLETYNLAFAVTETEPPDIELSNACLLREYYERPSKQYPDGRMAIATEGKVIDIGPNPYVQYGKNLELPFIPVFYKRNLLDFWGIGAIPDLIPPQKLYNRRLSQITEYGNIMSRGGKWVAQEGSLVRPITSNPGELVLHRPGTPPPVQIQPKGLPASMYADLDRCLAAFERISGQHEVSKGQVPAGVKSGVGLQFLAERDDTRLATPTMWLEEAIQKWGEATLRICKANYKESRTIAIVGRNKAVKVREIRGSDLKITDVRVEPGSAIPQSRTARQQFILDLWNAKIVQDPQMVVKLLEFGDVDDIFAEVNIDIDHAEREHLKLLEGQQVPAEDWHNHQVHLYVHNKFRKSAQWDELDQGIKTIFAAHIEHHKMLSMPAQVPAPNMPSPGALPPPPGGLPLPGGMPPNVPPNMPPELAALMGGGGGALPVQGPGP